MFDEIMWSGLPSQALQRSVQHGSRTFQHLLNKFLNGTKLHAVGLTVLDAGRQLSAPGTAGTKHAVLGREGEIVDGDRFVAPFHNEFGDLDSALPCRVVVLLLTCNFAGVATGTKIIINQQPIYRHVCFSSSIILASLTRVVLYCPPPNPESLS